MPSLTTMGLGLFLLAMLVMAGLAATERLWNSEDPDPWAETLVDVVTCLGLFGAGLIELLHDHTRADRPVGGLALGLIALQTVLSWRGRRTKLASVDALHPDEAEDARAAARLADVGYLIVMLPGAVIAVHLLVR